MIPNSEEHYWFRIDAPGHVGQEVRPGLLPCKVRYLVVEGRVSAMPKTDASGVGAAAGTTSSSPIRV